MHILDRLLPKVAHGPPGPAAWRFIPADGHEKQPEWILHYRYPENTFYCPASAGGN